MTGQEKSTKPTSTHAVTQVARLLYCCPVLSPREKTAATIQAREIADALIRRCQDDEHITRTVTQFLEQALECRNVIAELVRIAGQLETPETPPVGCESCEDYPDPATGVKRWRKWVVGAGDKLEYCVCLRGQWYRRKDAEKSYRPC